MYIESRFFLFHVHNMIKLPFRIRNESIYDRCVLPTKGVRTIRYRRIWKNGFNGKDLRRS